VTLLAMSGCTSAGTADDDDVVTTESGLVAAMPAFPFDHLPVEIKNVATGKCLDGTSAAPAVQRACSGAKVQSWFLIKSGIGYQLRASSAGMMLLGVNGASLADGALMAIWGGDGTGSESTFAFDSSTGGSFRLQTFASKCVEVKNGDTSDAAVIQQATCTTNDNQRWMVTPRFVSFSFVTKQALAADPKEHLCMDVPSGSQTNQTPVQQWWCSEGALNQRWYLQPSPTAGYYSIVSTNSGKCIDVPNASTTGGVQVQQFDCHGGDNQLWSFQSQSDGRVEIKNRHSGLCLNIGGSVAVNGPVVQGSCSGDGPRWFYTHVVRRHVEAVQVANDDGSNAASATNDQVALQLAAVKGVYEQWGVNLLFDGDPDRTTVRSTYLNTNFPNQDPTQPTFGPCPLKLLPVLLPASSCATALADQNWSSKVAIYVMTTGGGLSGGTNHWIKSSLIPGTQVCTSSGLPVVNDVRLWAHEFGHYMGLSHLGTGDHDLLADTRPDPMGDYCLAPHSPTGTISGQTVDTNNIMTYYYNPSYLITPTQAQIVRQTAYARWY